jgi:hypothetical protein
MPAGAAITDVRSLKEVKQPKSDNQMASLVAYYLKEAAPAYDRKDTISQDDIEKYFKQAGFPLPNRPARTLINAKNAGYFDPAGVGIIWGRQSSDKPERFSRKKRTPFDELGFMQKSQASEPRQEAHQTVRLQIDTKDSSPSIRISFTDQRLTGHGGMIVWSHFLHKKSFARFWANICRMILPTPTPI